MYAKSACHGLALPAVLAAFSTFAGLSSPVLGVAPRPIESVRAMQFGHPGLEAQTELVRAHQSSSVLAKLVASPDHAVLDRSTGRWATLLPTTPLLPGSGVGNVLTWDDLGQSAPVDPAALTESVERAFLAYLNLHADELKISLEELVLPLDISVIGDKVLVHAARAVDGVPVRNSFLSASLSHGNLVLFGAARWADVTTSTRPSIDERDARAVFDNWLDVSRDEQLRLESRTHRIGWEPTELVLVPFSESKRLTYRLAYSLKPIFRSKVGRWEALVDAHSAEVMSFRDLDQYSGRHVVGGVYPFTNDGVGSEGQEQPRWPMPYTDLNGGARFANRNGRLPGNFAGEVATTLDGLYVSIEDSCGPIDESSVGLGVDIDLGVSNGNDCTNPPGSSPGNTVGARTAFYEVNRIAEWARGRNRSNPWLNAPLTVTTNIDLSCGGSWNGEQLRLFQSGFGCSNTGEIASVIDHEWGHGMDDSDNNGFISFPAEGIADVYAALRLNESCIGRGFIESGNQCNGYGDPCTDCSGGIRDIDWMKRQSGAPHDVAWADANCTGGCGPLGTDHCLGAVFSETVWDLAKRDLPNQFGADPDLALELTTRFTITAAANVGDWFTCGADGEDGCAAEGGYLNYLAADDVDGDLTNGTPHMSAIFAAFDRHGIACSIPAVQNNGCEAAPTRAPEVTAAVGDSTVTLSWSPVPGATRYFVYRTEGTRACAKGKLFLGSSAGTTFVDTGVLNGFDYYYSVTSGAGGRSCLGPMSECLAATPSE